MATKKATTEVLTIPAPKFKVISIKIVGKSALMQNRFSAKAMRQMMDKMEAGSTARSKKIREARDFDEDFKNAQHISSEGWVGVPCAAFRNAAIDVCRMVGYKMTHARMAMFIEPDGFDTIDESPLVRLEAGEPRRVDMAVRNATGVADIRARPVWDKWGATVRVKFDSGQFTTEDIVNLFTRAGVQIGIGEGRPYSSKSNGMGYGTFEVEGIS